MDYPSLEPPPNDAVLNIRLAEFEAYLNRPDFERSISELPDITWTEKRWLAKSVVELYNQAKKTRDEEIRLKLIVKFRDMLALILCDDPQQRKGGYCPPNVVESEVLGSGNGCLPFGTGTMGERIYFKNYSGQEYPAGRYMVYHLPSSSSTERGKKYFKRFDEAFGANLVNLDTGKAEWGEL